MRPTKVELIAEIKDIIPRLIRKEHDFRVEFAHSKFLERTTGQRSPYFELEESNLWMTLYSHINWLAHFRFMKRSGVDKQIPGWISEAFGWPDEVAKSFWICGRNPIAHTGHRAQMHSVNVNRIKYYIGLQLDEQEGWGGSNGYFALSPMQRDIGGSPLPAQKYIFFYPNIEEMLPRFTNSIKARIDGLDYNGIKSLNALCRTFRFIKDDGSLHRMSELLRVYKYAS